MSRWAAVFIMAACVWLTAAAAGAAEPFGLLLRGADEADLIGDFGALPPESDALLAAVNLKDGQAVYAWDQDGVRFDAKIRGARLLPAGERFIVAVKVEIVNRQPDFDYLLTRESGPSREGKGPLYDAIRAMEEKQAVIEKIAAWWNDFMNRDIFDVANYGQAYAYEFLALPVPRSDRWLLSVRWTDRLGQGHAFVGLARVEPGKLPKAGVTLLERREGLFVETHQWFDYDRDGAPDVRAVSLDGDGMLWAWLEPKGDKLPTVFTPTWVQRREAPPAPATSPTP